MANKIDKILKHNMCLGCGLCESVLSKEKCEMKINTKGFYEPVFKTILSKEDQKTIEQVCPGINVSGKVKSVWGSVLNVSEAWSADKVIRHRASSGGIISTLAIYLLEKKMVDGILHVGKMQESHLYNELSVSKTRQEVLNNCASRYAPAAVFNRIKIILDSNKDTYAFIGKPCDIAGINNFIQRYPEYKHRIYYRIALFCAGMPSYKGTEAIIDMANTNAKATNINYRGNGWPGQFKVAFNDGSDFKLSYNDSWGNVLCKHLGMRCKICPDGIGLLADVAVGDSWSTKDGYPDFTEEDGRSFVLCRTTEGLDLFNKALQDKFIVNKQYSLKDIEQVQRYQHERRKVVAYRILPVQLSSAFLLHFKGLSILRNIFKANLKSGISNFIGTSKRVFTK